MSNWVHIRAISTILAAAIVFLAASSGCSSNPQYYRSNLVVEEPNTLAVLPLVNLSKYDEASDVVMNSLLVQLLDNKVFAIIDPGLVDNAVLEKRIRFTDRLPLQTMQELGTTMNAKYLLLGSVNEFDMISEHTETVPVVSISLRIVRAETGTIFWAATHTRRGDDAESVFGLGRIRTLEQLTAATVQEITSTLKK